MTKNKNSLYILYNGKPANMTTYQIFDSKKYTDILAVTYSTSGKFLKTYFNKFRNIKLIVGLRSNHLIRQVNQALEQIRHPMWPATLASLFIPSHYRIHDKLYILLDGNGQNFRIVTGSANLSFAAFGQTTPQSEEINIIDSPYAKPYQLKLACQHFDNLLSKTVNFPFGTENDPHPRLESDKSTRQAMAAYHAGHYWQSMGIITSILVTSLISRDLPLLAENTRIEGLDHLKLRKYKLAHNAFKLAALYDPANIKFKWRCKYDDYRCKWRKFISQISKTG